MTTVAKRNQSETQGNFELSRTLKPLNDLVFIKKLPLDKVSTGGIILPKNEDHQYIFLSIAEVLDTGPKVEQEGLVPGALVAFNEAMMTRAQWAGDDNFGLLKEANCLAIVVDK